MDTWNNVVSDAFPLTAMQSAILNQSLRSNDGLYIEQLAVEITGSYDVELNKQAWEAVTRAHPALRTRIYFSGLKQPHQVVFKPSHSDVPWSFSDLNDDTFNIHDYAEKEKNKGFDLENETLFRVNMLRVSDNKWYMLLTVHHVIIDGWSFGVLAKELGDAYIRLSSKESGELPPAPSLAHHIKRVSLLEQQNAVTFWKDKLHGYDVGKAPDPQVGHSGKGQGSVDVLRSKAWRDSIQAGCQALSITESSLFQSACSLVMARWTHEDNTVLGMTTLMRELSQYDESRIVGPLLNTIPQAWRFDWSQSCGEYLTQRHQELSESFRHNQLPLSHIMKAAEWETSCTPFQVLTVFQYEEHTAESDTGLPFSVTPVLAKESVGYPMAIYAWPGEPFKIQVRYDASRWSEALMNVLANSICDVMTSLVNECERPLSGLATYSLMEPQVNNPIENTPPLLSQRLRELVQDQPESTFIEDKVLNVTLNYSQAWKKVVNLITLLEEQGVEKGQVIACFSRNEHQSILHMLAVMEMGACYLGIDAQYPEQRITDMLADSGSKHLLFNESMPVWLNEHCEVNHIQPVDGNAARSDHKEQHSYSTTQGDDVAYLIYTSGTTGTPKASLNTHEGLASRMAFLSSTMDQPHRLLQCSGMSFDAVVLEVLMLLSGGGTLVFDDIDRVRNPQEITTIIQSHQITMIFLPPALLTHVDANHVEKLSWVGVGGDRCPPALAKLWSERGQLYNLYGPSEVSIFCVANPVHETRKYDSIGMALSDVDIELVDQCGHALPNGVSGELYIGGKGVAKGYHQRDELTSERFVSCGLSSVYRSGDQCQKDDNGFVSILGRLDTQIKIRGVRVELSEIEYALSEFASVKEARVVPAYKDGQVDALHAYYLTEDARPLAAEVIRQHLVRQLPNSVIPSTFTFLRAWPLTPNNKIDMKALTQKKNGQGNQGVIYSGVELKLLNLLNQLLQGEVLSLDQSFFAMGGSSLQVAQCVSQLRDTFDVDIPMNEFYQLPSMQVLADWLSLTKDGHKMPLSQIVTHYDLGEEAVLDPALVPEELPKAEDGDWLLTGVTGFVGAHLCASMLRNTNRHVVCLVRADDKKEGFSRVKRKLTELKIWCDDYQERISIVVGDLSQPQLGLGQEPWQRLAKSVSHIVHCGALVNFAYPYGLLKQANVEATRTLLELASTSTRKSFDFVSTMSLISAASEIDRISESSVMPNWQHLIGGYNQSKWVAEQLCLQAHSQGLDVAIYRLASMAGDKRSGINNEKDIIWRSVQACHLLDAYPESVALADLTMTDEVADVLVRAKVDEVRRPVWHMNNPEPMPWSTLYKEALVKGNTLKPLSASKWRKALLARLEQYPELSNLVPYTVEEDDVTTQLPIVADSTLTQTYIESLGLSLSAVSPELFAFYTDVLTPLAPQTSMK
ncbi:thioester reductase domain-containing protein [Vibrio sp. Of7-15]|uniref:thioester reductase domain-containing protein n=1 Tax=Vibrio sp. Of7-15 TaxID=2724879 RepID=UPI001EF170F3|nr:thioester reductase domain-containing protein [Vibrio sp. Of7-15]